MLKMITWEGDLTQFLVEAEDNDAAIQKAIKANEDIWSDHGGFDSDEAAADTYDTSTYTVDDVDILLLNEIFGRKDYGGMYGDTIVFWN